MRAELQDFRGFLHTPEKELVLDKYKEPSLYMLIPVVILAAATLILGLYPMPLITFISGIANALM